MCRMIASLGGINQSELMSSFIIMAHGWGEISELNPKMEDFQHNDGWGAVYKEKDAYKIYKSPKAVWEDPTSTTIEQKCPLILHSRHKSVGEVSYENTHPFQKTDEGKEWFFCHNGTIYEQLPKYNGLEGETDSEKLFCMLLEGFDENNDVSSIEKTINKLSDYSSINSFLFNGKYLYAINKYDEDKYPSHFSLNLFIGETAIILASERLLDLNMKGLLYNWKQLKNGQIVKMGVENNIVELF